ncbi:LytTR family DNA-binding domain-containing protein [Rhizobium alvei]|uniref:LytTR family DNA-binding domain-containing protein n=1 Tax=Rhizobium alvei TaxID=1132659 RepID=A0ABT8YLR2_9HYPH|nr:LytTR family DNA-binding domain-containing protein [Rhizobium alvei]MDO6964177.1 LytTR family DNA-binding domain-containing protein [Rhizobium alvei]
MNDSFLQSTLRELKIFTGSSRFWITFAAVVLLFGVTGPFDTSSKLQFGPRLAYWLLVHFCAWSFAILFVVSFNVGLRPYWSSLLARMLAGATVASLPSGAAIALIEYSWHGEPFTWQNYLGAVGNTLPLNLILCAITAMAMTSSDKNAHALKGIIEPQTRPPDDAQASVASEATTASTQDSAPPSSGSPPLIARLRPENRGALLHISVEDHYTVVTTSRGREMLLMRFSDAIRETEPAIGLRVHRSHWVAKDFISGLSRDAGRLTLQLKDGGSIPVSRTHQDAVRDFLA